MKSALLTAILSLLTSVSAYAYDVETGSVMICDTQSQVERYAQLFNGDPQVAIATVNGEEHDPNACAVADVTYVQGPELDIVRGQSHAFRVVPILVIAMNTPRGYREVKPALFFTPVEVKEFAV